MGKKQKNRKSEQPGRLRRMIAAVVLLVIILPYLACWWKSCPAGFSVRSKPCRVSADGIRLLIDSTSFDTAKGERIFDQQIFDTILEMVRDAEQAIYIDFFLWNSWTGTIPESHRNLAAELADALIAKKKETPGTHILVMTDPVNRVYGRDELPFYEAMRQAGICIVFTDLGKMPESNIFYAAPARFYGPLISRIPGIRQLLNLRLLKHPFEAGGKKVSPLQFARLLFFKANHRKVVISDGPGGWRLLVTSFNPATGSSGHSNIGLQVGGDIALEALATELECAKWSTENPGSVLEPEPGACARTIQTLAARLVEARPPQPEESVIAEWLTEECIAEKAEAILDRCGPGDEVRLAMFYLADRKLITAIKEAADGGADVRIILDANRDAFGRVKNGVPNRPAAAELMEHAAREGGRLQIRWADTHGEQFHPKVLSVVNAADGKAELLCGSANWTRRNLRDLNLEANVHLKNAQKASREFAEWFDLCWGNTDGRGRTVAYEIFAISGFERFHKALTGRFREATGMSTF